VIRIREIDHLVLRTHDVQTMIEFYGRVFGCTVEKRQEAFGLVQLRAGNALLDLVAVDEPVDPSATAANLDHFCFRIDPFDEALIQSHLAACGVLAGATESRYGAEGRGPSIYIKDPDGNTVELKGPPDPSLGG